MRAWADPILTDSETPGAGETNVNRASHVTDLRNEIQKASLWLPYLDERPVYTRSFQANSNGSTDNIGTKDAVISYGSETTLLDVTGSGVVRSIWMTLAYIKIDEVTLRIYVDNEATPRVECLFSDFCFASIGVQSPLHSKWTGVSGVPPLGANPSAAARPLVGWRKTPIPYHSRVRITVESMVAKSAGQYGMFANILYNHSATIDYDYGRYNYFNLAKTVADPVVGGVTEYLNVSGKRGALFGVYYGMIGEEVMLEGDTHFNIDGAGLQGDSGTEDYFFDGWYWSSWLESYDNNVRGRIVPQMLPLVAGDSHGVNLALWGGLQPVHVGAYRYYDDAPLCWETSFAMHRHDGDADMGGPESPSTCTYVALYYTET
jgi:hypothetical protein